MEAGGSPAYSAVKCQLPADVEETSSKHLLLQCAFHNH